MFEVIESVLGAVLLLAGLIVWIRLKPATSKNRIVFILGFWGVLFTASAFFMFVKDSRTFQTPEEAFQSEENGTIEFVVQGKDSCVVYYRENENTWSTLYLLQDEKGYHTVSPPAIETTRSDEIADGASGTFSLYRVRGTQDYYADVLISAEHSKLDAVFDMKGNPVQVVEIGRSVYICILFVDDPSEACMLRVGDAVVALW